MSDAHVSDEIIQAFALNENYHDAEAAAHLEHCETCREAVASYQRMFSAIEALPPGAFDFDVKALVLPQLPASAREKTQPKQKTALMPLLAAVLTVVPALGIGGYVFRKDLGEIFGPSRQYLLYCLGPAAVLLLLWMVTDMLSRYRQKMTRLEYYQAGS